MSSHTNIAKFCHDCNKNELQMILEDIYEMISSLPWTQNYKFGYTAPKVRKSGSLKVTSANRDALQSQFVYTVPIDKINKY